jgi:hypothetical protein
MKRNYHPDYEKLALLYDDSERSESKKDIPFDDFDLEFEREVDYLKIFLFVLVLGLAGLSIYLYTRIQNHKPQPQVIGLLQEHKIESARNLEEEIDKMQLVLSDLILSIETIAKERAPEGVNKEFQEQEITSKVVRVKTTSANLREEPNLKSKTLEIVNKDTELLFIDHESDWIKTYSPSGKISWIHTSVVTFVGDTR